jgi:hypothetical protein
MIDPTFKLVFLAVLGLTLMSMLVSLYLVSVESASPTGAQELLRVTSGLTQTGVGAIVGLLGGRALSAKR